MKFQKAKVNVFWAFNHTKLRIKKNKKKSLWFENMSKSGKIREFFQPGKRVTTTRTFRIYEIMLVWIKIILIKFFQFFESVSKKSRSITSRKQFLWQGNIPTSTYFFSLGQNIKIFSNFDLKQIDWFWDNLWNLHFLSHAFKNFLTRN